MLKFGEDIGKFGFPIRKFSHTLNLWVFLLKLNNRNSDLRRVIHYIAKFYFDTIHYL